MKKIKLAKANYLTSGQLRALSRIAADAGQVFLATMVVPFLVGLDKVSPSVLPSGLILTFGSWILSVLLAKGEEDD